MARLSQRISDLLQVTKLLTVFEVFDDEEKAAKSFKKDAAETAKIIPQLTQTERSRWLRS